MIKNLIKLLKIVFLTFIIYVFLSKPNIIINSVNYSMSIFLENLLPTLFPFFVLVDFLFNYGYIDYIRGVFRFKYGYLILLSMISGLPSNAKYIKTFLDSKMISIKDAEVMLSVTFFPNPMFVISSVGLLMMGSVKLGCISLISVYLSNFILYLFYYKSLDKNKGVIYCEKLSFSKLLSSSIINNARTLLVILGTVMFFITILNIISHYTSLNHQVYSVISGILEMTSGIKNMSTSAFSTQGKYIFISMFLAFSGFSVLMQAFSILSDYKIDVRKVIKNKIIVTLINLFINYFYIVFFV